jgi:hypothetical protein
VLAVVAVRARPAAKASLYGTAGGVVFGFQAAVVKGFNHVLHGGLGAIVASPSTYGLIVSSVAGFCLVQISLQTGALAPAVASGNATIPIASAGLGRALFHETPQHASGGTIVSLVSLALLVVGLVSLARGEAAS